MNAKTESIPPALTSVIVVTTSIALIYLISLLLSWPPLLIFALLLSAMGATGWMAIRILKDSYTTDKTFDQLFYPDRPDITRNAQEDLL